MNETVGGVFEYLVRQVRKHLHCQIQGGEQQQYISVVSSIRILILNKIGHASVLSDGLKYHEDHFTWKNGPRSDVSGAKTQRNQSF